MVIQLIFRVCFTHVLILLIHPGCSFFPGSFYSLHFTSDALRSACPAPASAIEQQQQQQQQRLQYHTSSRGQLWLHEPWRTSSCCWRRFFLKVEYSAVTMKLQIHLGRFSGVFSMIFNYSRSYKVWSLILVQDGNKGNSQLLFCWFFKNQITKIIYHTLSL